MNENRLLTVDETAKMLGIQPKTIRNQLARNSKVKFPIKPKRVGRLVRFPLSSVQKFINE